VNLTPAFVLCYCFMQRCVMGQRLGWQHCCRHPTKPRLLRPSLPNLASHRNRQQNRRLRHLQHHRQPNQPIRRLALALPRSSRANSSSSLVAGGANSKVNQHRSRPVLHPNEVGQLCTFSKLSNSSWHRRVRMRQHHVQPAQRRLSRRRQTLSPAHGEGTICVRHDLRHFATVLQRRSLRLTDMSREANEVHLASNNVPRNVHRCRQPTNLAVVLAELAVQRQFRKRRYLAGEAGTM
jgi:hypothetical protein